MKLLLISNEYPPIGGGGSTVVKYLAKDLVKKGHKVHLITSSFRDLPKKEIIDGYTVHRIPAIRLKIDYCSMWELAIFSVSAVFYTIFFSLKFKPDVVQAFFAVPAGGVAFVLNLLFGIPYVIFLGGSDVPNANPYRYKSIYPILSPLIKLIWRSAHTVVAASEGLAKIARDADPRRDFVVIPNGVDTKYFKKTPVANKVLKILGVGRLMPRKGYQFVIKALPEVSKKTKAKFEFVVGGGGEYLETLKSLAKKMKVEDKVRFIGQVDYAEIHKEYLTSDIFAHPSLAEGMPLALLEGIASGLPAITTKVPGNEDLVENKVNGFLLKKGDVKGIEAALIKLINSKKLRNSMGMESVRIAKDFDWKNISDKYDIIYKKIYEERKKK